jgi:hypothetical protein
MPICWHFWPLLTDAYVAGGGYGTRGYYWLIQRCAENDPWFQP